MVLETKFLKMAKTCHEVKTAPFVVYPFRKRGVEETNNELAPVHVGNIAYVGLRFEKATRD